MRVAHTLTVHHCALAFLLGIDALRASEAAAIRIEDYYESTPGVRVASMGSCLWFASMCLPTLAAGLPALCAITMRPYRGGMCEHCGCRGVVPIADLMDEHLELLELAGEVRGHLAQGESQAACRSLRRLERLLDDHVRREERGVFAAMKAQGDFADAVLDLEAEHDSFSGALGTLDPGSPDFGDRVRLLLEELSTHIDKENLGIFPVAVVTLGAYGWDLVSRAHADHPHPHRPLERAAR